LVFRSSPVDGGGFIVDVSFHRSVGASHSPLPAIDATRRIVERHALIEVPLSDPKCRRESNGKTTLSPAAWRIALFASWAYGGRTDHHVSQSAQERDRLTRGCDARQSRSRASTAVLIGNFGHTSVYPHRAHWYELKERRR